MGILQSRQALTMAKEHGLDLVMVSPSANPPVCKILDYGRYKYLADKQQKESRRKQQDVKGIKISPRIAEHDVNFQTKKAREFLGEGHKVKVTCQFRAREVTHPELGLKKLMHMAELLQDVATVERTPTLDGRLMVMILLPKPQSGKKEKHAKAENQQNGGEEVQGDGVGKDHAPEGL